MVDIRLDTTKLEGRLASIPGALEQRMRLTFAQMQALFERAMKRRFRPYRGEAYPDGLQTRTGTFRNTIRSSRVEGSSLKTLKARVFTDAIQAPLQEFGGVVRPKQKQFLRVPLDAALTTGGDVKGGMDLVQRGNRFTTADGHPTFIRRNVIFVDRPGDGVTPIWVLKRSVRVPKRLGWFRTFQGQAAQRQALLAKAFRGAIGG